MVSGTTAVGSQQLADEVDSAGSLTKEEKRYMQRSKTRFMYSDIWLNILFEY